MGALRVGIVGIGNISGIYFKNLVAFPETEVVAVADLDLERAAKAAEEHGVPHVLTPDELLSHPDVDLVLNLTVPKVHGAIARKAIANGKHVYNEKPLATEWDDALALIAEARAKGLEVGCAPDTFLGAGLQTARKAVDQGLIGTPISAKAAMMGFGPEPWHPNPDFFYKPGGGPMLDMGPYYLTALVHLLGPIKRLAGLSKATFPERTVGSGDRQGEKITVETPTFLEALLDFHSGAIADLTTSFDTAHNVTDWSHPIIVFGTDGVMKVPDPNGFGGDVLIKGKDHEDWTPVEVTHDFPENSRGLGVRQIALSLQGKSPNYASGDLAAHVLEAMLSVQKSSETGQFVTLSTHPERPQAMPELVAVAA